jgi:hypothetical protein
MSADATDTDVGRKWSSTIEVVLTVGVCLHVVREFELS